MTALVGAGKATGSEDDICRATATAAALLAAAEDVTLLAHVRPDADALGSALALGTALYKRGARVQVSFGFPDHVPETLLYGQGTALLFHDGRVVKATWHKDKKPTSTIKLTTKKGELKVPVGHTWVELVPNGRTVTVTP